MILIFIDYEGIFLKKCYYAAETDIETHFASHNDLKLVMFLPQPLKHLNYKYVKTQLNLVVCIRLILCIFISVVLLMIILCLNIYYL